MRHMTREHADAFGQVDNKSSSSSTGINSISHNGTRKLTCATSHPSSPLRNQLKGVNNLIHLPQFLINLPQESGNDDECGKNENGQTHSSSVTTTEW